jgi:cbb3-type cytochrome oxidase subunit 3
MALKHWFFIALVIIALLYIWHIYSSHGGVSGFKAGLGA